MARDRRDPRRRRDGRDAAVRPAARGPEPTTSSSPTAVPSGPPSSPSGTASRSSTTPRRREGRHRAPRRQAAGHGRPARRDRRRRPRPAQLVVSHRGGHHDRLRRGAAARGHAGRAGDAEHARRSSTRAMAAISPRVALRRGAPRPRPRPCSRPPARSSRVPESQQDAVTAISGTGPAYLFFVVEAMIEAGVLLGLPRATSHRARRPDRCRLRQDAAGDRRAPDGAARAGHVARRARRSAAVRQLEDHRVRAAFLTAHGGGAGPLARARGRRPVTVERDATSGCVRLGRRADGVRLRARPPAWRRSGSS